MSVESYAARYVLVDAWARLCEDLADCVMDRWRRPRVCRRRVRRRTARYLAKKPGEHEIRVDLERTLRMGISCR